jgi:hypothetical protein
VYVQKHQLEVRFQVLVEANVECLLMRYAMYSSINSPKFRRNILLSFGGSKGENPSNQNINYLIVSLIRGREVA